MATSRLDDRRIWLGGSAVVALLIVVVSWFMLIHPKLADAQDLRDQAGAAEDQAAGQAAKNAALAKKFARIDQMQAKLRKATTAIPGDADFAGFTVEASTLEQLTGVHVTALTLGTPSAVAGSAASPSSTADGSTTQSGSSTTETTATSTTVTPPAATAQQIAVTISATGSRSGVLEYVHALQHGPRDLLVTSVTLAGTHDKQTLSLQATIFSNPLTKAQLAVQKSLLAPVHTAK